MRTVSDLRQAMLAETKDLAPRVTLAQVRTRARRRRSGWLVGSILAALLPLVAGLLVNAAQPAEPPPKVPIVIDPSFPAVDPSFPAVGGVIRTGVQVGSAEELVLWFPDAGSLHAGLFNRSTNKVRTLEPSVTSAPSTGFAELGQIDDRRGGIVDYGLFIGAVARVTLSAGSDPIEARLAPWSRDPSYTAFWVRRTGKLLEPSQGPDTIAEAQPRFTAYDARGKVVATSEGQQSTRTDGSVNVADRPPVGDPIHTGTPTAGGGELIFWFVGGDQDALLKAGTSDPAGGSVNELRALGGYHRPPFAIGFYGGLQTFDGPGGKQIVVGIYVGPAARVVMGAPGEGVTTGFARWSAHPEFVIVWAANVPTDVVWRASAVAYDDRGAVIEATDFRN